MTMEVSTGTWGQGDCSVLGFSQQWQEKNHHSLRFERFHTNRFGGGTCEHRKVPLDVPRLRFQLDLQVETLSGVSGLALEINVTIRKFFIY